MKAIKRAVLLVLALAVAAAACGCALGGNGRIGKDAALQIALEDAGLTPDEAEDVETELERSIFSVWYEVSFESGRNEYEYRIDARTGEIISSVTD